MIIFVFITMVGAVASGMLARFIRAIELGWLDRTLGAAFGFVRGLLMATVVIWGIMAFIPVLPKYLISDSRLAPYVMDSARRIADASPEEVKEGFRNSYRELNKVLPERIKERLSTVPNQI
jgi:membrane protein required for colicin V production